MHTSHDFFHPWRYEADGINFKIVDSRNIAIASVHNQENAQLIAAALQLLHAANLGVYALHHPQHKEGAVNALKKAIDLAIQHEPQPPKFGFVIELKNGYLGEDGQPTTDLQSAKSFDEYEEAETEGEEVPEFEYVAEYVVNNGQRELAYEPD